MLNFLKSSNAVAVYLFLLAAISQIGSSTGMEQEKEVVINSEKINACKSQSKIPNRSFREEIWKEVGGEFLTNTLDRAIDVLSNNNVMAKFHQTQKLFFINPFIKAKMESMIMQNAPKNLMIHSYNVEQSIPDATFYVKYYDNNCRLQYLLDNPRMLADFENVDIRVSYYLYDGSFAKSLVLNTIELLKKIYIVNSIIKKASDKEIAEMGFRTRPNGLKTLTVDIRIEEDEDIYTESFNQIINALNSLNINIVLKRKNIFEYYVHSDQQPKFNFMANH